MFRENRIGCKERIETFPLPVELRIGANDLPQIKASKHDRIVAAAIQDQRLANAANFGLQSIDGVNVR